MQLKIRNDFDPVLSPESSLFVLKSNKQVGHCNSFCCEHIDATVSEISIWFSLLTGDLSRYCENS